MPPEVSKSGFEHLLFGSEEQERLGRLCEQMGLVEDKSQKVIDTFMSAIRERLAPFTDFPILFISAMTKQRILKVLETARRFTRIAPSVSLRPS